MNAITLQPGRRYFPASLDDGDSDYLYHGGAVPHAEVDIALGHSRYGGPLIDLPPGVEPRAGYQFAAQLHLPDFAPLDPDGRLPPTGQLYFWFRLTDDYGEEVLVDYYDVPASTLERHVVEHDRMFFEGVLVIEPAAATETWAERLVGEARGGGSEGEDNDGDEDWDDLDADMTDEERAEYEKFLEEYGDDDDDDGASDGDAAGEGEALAPWDDDDEDWDEEDEAAERAFVGTDVSKLLGLPTHVQWSEEELQEAAAGHVVLLHIGERGFNDEGVFCVLVPEEDLARRQFERAKGWWAQT